MKKKIIVASNYSKSINRKVAEYMQANLDQELEIMDLLKYDVPMYSMDIEEESGIPQSVKDILEEIKEADEIILATPEYNGHLTPWFKNIFDWVSREEFTFLAGKKVRILATTPGAGAASSVRAAMVNSLPFYGAEVVKDLGIASFYDIVEFTETGIEFKDEAQVEALKEFLK